MGIGFFLNFEGSFEFASPARSFDMAEKSESLSVMHPFLKYVNVLRDKGFSHFYNSSSAL